MFAFLHKLNHVYLDHLLSFSSVFKIPFAYVDPKISKFLSLYPSVETKQLSLDELASLPNSIVHCEPPYHIDQLFFLENQSRARDFYWLSHGESDKELFASPYQTLKHSTHLIFPGEKAKNIFCSHHPAWEKIVIAGNFRAQAHPPSQWKRSSFTILYAPTWDDTEGASSLETFLPLLAQIIPKDITLLIKPHPRSINSHHLIDATEKSHVHLLGDHLPLYSYLPQVDVVITDRSSIGYDACYLDIPIICLNHTNRSWKDKTCYYHAGHVLNRNQYPHVLDYLNQEDRFNEQRQFYGSYAFSETGGKMVTYSNNERFSIQAEAERS